MRSPDVSAAHRKTDHSLVEVAAKSMRPGGQPGSGMTLVVIVDDRATNRTIYSKLAQSIGEGVKVRAFGDPCDALVWLEGARPDLIVTDHDMPGIDGDEFISRFRALPQAAGVPIMMITVNDQRMLRLRALESGATDFLTTPIDHFEFLTARAIC